MKPNCSLVSCFETSCGVWMAQFTAAKVRVNFFTTEKNRLKLFFFNFDVYATMWFAQS